MAQVTREAERIEADSHAHLSIPLLHIFFLFPKYIDKLPMKSAATVCSVFARSISKWVFMEGRIRKKANHLAMDKTWHYRLLILQVSNHDGEIRPPIVERPVNKNPFAIKTKDPESEPPNP